MVITDITGTRSAHPSSSRESQGKFVTRLPARVSAARPSRATQVSAPKPAVGLSARGAGAELARRAVSGTVAAT